MPAMTPAAHEGDAWRTSGRPPASAPGGPCAIRVPIRWRDLDAYGHVNQSVYLTFVEEVVDEWLRRRLGLPAGTTCDYVVVRSTIDYRSELRLADVEVVGTVVSRAIGRKSVTLGATLQAADGRVAADVESVLVLLDGAGGATREVTADERAALTAP
jgi:acyl-CoA thioester hydrolase